MEIDFPSGKIYVYKADMVKTQSTPVEIYSHSMVGFYLDLMLQQDSENGRPFPLINDYGKGKTVGGTPLAPSLEITPYYEVEYTAGNYIVDLVGMNTNVSSRTIANGVSIRPQNTAGLTDVSVLSSASYGGKVVVSTTRGQAGTAVPIGTLKTPSNNVDDSVIIAHREGLGTLFFPRSYTITENVEDFILRGQNSVLSKLVIDPSANVLNCQISDVIVNGTLDGESLIEDCYINGLNYVNGEIRRSTLEEAIIFLGGTKEARFMECKSGVSGAETANISMGGTGQSLLMRNYVGGIRIMGRTGNDPCSIDLVSGHVIIDASCTGSPITIRGSYKLTVEEGATPPDTIGRTMMESHIDTIWNHDSALHLNQSVWVDTERPTDGNGSQQFPFNNVNSGKDYAEIKGIRDIYLAGDIVLPSSIKNMNLHGVGLPRIDFNGHDVKGSRFHQCKLKGDYTDSLIAVECTLENDFYLSGHFLTCNLLGNVIAKPNTVVLLASCMSGVNSASISMNAGTNTAVTVNGFTNDLLIKDADNALDNITVNMTSGDLTFNNTCVNGDLTAKGDCKLIDNSVGKIVKDETTIDAHMGYTRP